MTQILKMCISFGKVKIFCSIKQKDRYRYVIPGNISAVEGVI